MGVNRLVNHGVPIIVIKETGSNQTVSSTTQSLNFRTLRRIVRNPRLCARLMIGDGLRERLRAPKLREFGDSYPGAILRGPSASRRDCENVPKAVAI